MNIEIIPAIDLIDGKCVRLTQGDYDEKKVYADNPVDVARQFEAQGVRRLHLVDLDGARSKHVVNLPVVEAIARETNLIIDFGGGIKSDDDIKKVFDAGAQMVTVGSVAVTQPTLLMKWLNEYGADHIILGADVKNERISINGWKEEGDESLLPFIERYMAYGIKNVLCTDISKDGMLTGPAIDLYKKILNHYPTLNLIASGGVGQMADIEQLDAIGVRQVVVGKAIYEGRVRLKINPSGCEASAIHYSLFIKNKRMLAKRIIPCLDIKDGQTVKGVNFVNLQQAGDPIALGKAYSEQGADELVYLDITASHEGRKTFTQLVSRIAEEINIPFTVGGGINELADVDRLLSAGADKVSINSAALRRPELIDEIARHFGSQVCVVAIDAKETDGQWRCYLNGGRVETERDLFDWALEANRRGAGEILFTSMNHDGVKQGFANTALSRLADELTIPVIASGGAGSMEHFRDAFTQGHADAALAASVFHFGEIGIRELKEYLKQQNITVRL